MSDLVVKFWYEDVVAEIDKIIDAIEYYKRVHASGLQYTKMKGVIHRLLQEQPGLMQIYEDTLVDAQMVGKWLEEEIRYMKAQKRLQFMKDPQLREQLGDLKKTDIDNLIVADEDIRYYIQLQLMMELWVKMLAVLVERLNKRSIYLTMISKLRIAGEHEAYIDTTHETNPETL